MKKLSKRTWTRLDSAIGKLEAAAKQAKQEGFDTYQLSKAISLAIEFLRSNEGA